MEQLTRKWELKDTKGNSFPFPKSLHFSYSHFAEKHRVVNLLKRFDVMYKAMIKEFRFPSFSRFTSSKLFQFSKLILRRIHHLLLFLNLRVFSFLRGMCVSKRIKFKSDIHRGENETFCRFYLFIRRISLIF